MLSPGGEVSKLRIEPRSDQFVEFGGEIVKTVNYYQVSWTEVRKGFVDRFHHVPISDLDSLPEFMYGLTSRMAAL